MRGLPFWMIATLAVLSAVMIGVGVYELEHAGPFPLILGIIWALFTLASIGAKTKPDPR